LKRSLKIVQFNPVGSSLGTEDGRLAREVDMVMKGQWVQIEYGKQGPITCKNSYTESKLITQCLRARAWAKQLMYSPKWRVSK
jgi:hypothetical protein